jgi:salicylate hydroxylase
VLLGDAAHPPLQYIAQGAIMAIEDGYVLAEHLAAGSAADIARADIARADIARADIDRADIDRALAAYQAVRAEHCRRVVTASRDWGVLWHLDGEKRQRRNEILRARYTRDYSFVDWLYSITALTPAEEPAMFREIPLDVPATAPVA